MKKWKVFRDGESGQFVEAHVMNVKDDYLYFYRVDDIHPYVIFKNWDCVWDMEQFERDKTP